MFENYKKVSFNIASEASYIYKMVRFGEFLKTLKLRAKKCYQTGKFYLDKYLWKMPKMVNFGEFLKTLRIQNSEVEGQKVLPDR